VPDARIVFPDEIQELDLVRDDLTLIYRPVKKRVHVNGDDYTQLKFAGEKRSVIVRSVNVRLPMLRMEIHPCGNPVCDIHQREIDEDVLQCPDHWPVERELEKVYGVD
jgi:ATP-dependent Clp protease adapter protein ClpS